jgi:DNA helicase II / ATP-dependent DNA helicase PcrA
MSWEMTVGEEAVLTAPRVQLDGTPQQEAFWGELEYGENNVILEARAGTGKSTSCREGMWRLIEGSPRKRRIRYCAFGRAIADEFRPKCPPGVEVDTTHGFAWKVLQKATGIREVTKDKNYQILDQLGGQSLAKWKRRAIDKLVGLAKNSGFHPSDASTDRISFLDSLIDQYDIETYRDRDMIVDLADDVLGISHGAGMADFDDMLWMTWLNGLDFPSVDYLFIDECQDLNPVQRMLIPRMNPDGRTVAVGDPFQAIFAFRGADSDSMPHLKADLRAKVLPLTVTFRCPGSHVDLARELVPDFEAAPEAPEGTLRYTGPDVIEDANPGDLVICRMNAPVISACLRMIARRRSAFVRGRAIGDQLGSVVRRLEGDTIAKFCVSLDRWKNQRIAALSARDGIEDKIEAISDQAACLDTIASTCGSPAEIPAVISALFEDSTAKDRVTFSSIHRAKGSEARSVYLIQIPYNVQHDRYRRERPLPNWQIDARRNLSYVGLTRSLDSLYIVNPKGNSQDVSNG